MLIRRKTKIVKIGNVKIGGNNPIAVQSMAKVKTSNIKSVLKQIKELKNSGCAIVRLAVKDKEDARAIAKIKKSYKAPLVADIHFDYKLALEAVKSGIDKIRLNPGNIYKKNEVREVVNACKDRRIPIRIGLNSGSLPKQKTNAAKKLDVSEKLVKAAHNYIKLLEDFHFFDIVVSLKSSDVLETIGAYQKLAKLCDYPFHLGVTASGPLEPGLIKSSLGLGILLFGGIGDTIRVSLTDDPAEEIYAAKLVLQNLGLGKSSLDIISCPTCGRCEIDLLKIVRDFEKKIGAMNSKTLNKKNKAIKVALMGCVVNGPGEAADADLGVAFGKNAGLFFKKGKPQFKVDMKSAGDVILKELRNI